MTKFATGNKGKPKGAKNKVGKDLREMISNFLEANFSKIKKDFNTLPPKDRAKLYCDLLQYSLPRLQAVSTDISFDKLSEEELDLIVEKLKKAALDGQ